MIVANSSPSSADDGLVTFEAKKFEGDGRHLRRKIMIIKLGIGLSLLLSPAALFLGGNPWVHRVDQFSTKTTAGRYLVECDGYLSPAANAPLLPAKLLGTVSADDEGNFTGSSTVMIGGGPSHKQTVTGTEHLNPDGTGTITYDQIIDNQQGPPLDITFVASKHGERIDGLATDPGTVFSCNLRRIAQLDQDKD
jgi:hypothetical protein